MGRKRALALVCQRIPENPSAIGETVVFYEREVDTVELVPADRPISLPSPQGETLSMSVILRGRNDNDLHVILDVRFHDTMSRLETVLAWGCRFRVWPDPQGESTRHYVCLWPYAEQAKRHYYAGLDRARHQMDITWTAISAETGDWGGWMDGKVVWTTYDDFAAGTHSTAATGMPDPMDQVASTRAQQVQTASRPNTIADTGMTTHGELILASVNIEVGEAGQATPP